MKTAVDVIFEFLRSHPLQGPQFRGNNAYALDLARDLKAAHAEHDTPRDVCAVCGVYVDLADQNAQDFNVTCADHSRFRKAFNLSAALRQEGKVPLARPEPFWPQ